MMQETRKEVAILTTRWNPRDSFITRCSTTERDTQEDDDRTVLTEEETTTSTLTHKINNILEQMHVQLQELNDLKAWNLELQELVDSQAKDSTDTCN